MTSHELNVARATLGLAALVLVVMGVAIGSLILAKNRLDGVVAAAQHSRFAQCVNANNRRAAAFRDGTFTTEQIDFLLPQRDCSAVLGPEAK